MYFTESSYEVSGSHSSKTTRIKRTLRKKPWFSQRMNIQGRALQLVISIFIAWIGFGVGLKFAKIPPTAEAFTLLLKHGYRGPYYGLQVVDLDLHPAFNPENPMVAASITLHNFDSEFALGKPIQVTLKQKSQPRHMHHTIPCCKTPIRPHSSIVFETKIENVQPSVNSVMIQVSE